jgi:hypothetical protein
MKTLKILSRIAVSLMLCAQSHAIEWTARGIGSVTSLHGLSATQMIVMAREAAVMDAQKAILEQVKGFEMTSDSRVVHKALENEIITKHSKGIMRSGKIVSEKQIGSQVYEVVMVYEDNTKYDKALAKEEIVDLVESKAAASDTVPCLNISPTETTIQALETAARSEEANYDHKPPAWLFGSNDIEDNSDNEDDEVTELKRINNLKKQTIESLNRQLKLKKK